MKDLKNKILDIQIFNRRFLRDDFIRHAGITMAGTQLAGVINLLFHLLMVRILDVVDYGVLNSLVVFTVFFGQLTAAIQPALAKFFAEELARGKIALAAATAKRAGRDLGLVVAVHLPACLPPAFLQGAQKFTPLAFLNVTYALVKLLVGVGLVLVGAGVAGALSGYFFGPFLMLLAGVWLIRRYFHRRPASPEIASPAMGPIYRYVVPTLLALLSFAVLTNVDITLVKAFFSPQDAGYYSVAQMVGKIILFLPAAVAVVVFPKAASLKAMNSSAIHLFHRGLKLAALLSGSATAVCWLLPETVLRILTGKTDPEIISLVGLFALAMSFYSLLWLEIFYNLSVGATRFIKFLLLAAAGQVTAICIYHPDLRTVLILLNIFGCLSFLGTFFLTPGSFRLPLHNPLPDGEGAGGGGGAGS
ncbi:MAG: oligosaccharide flippase family protein [Candidatus Erginobacter occultus]|nr:oligosaccharide flippase family protein [Candidatus Erginobacter occultus]